MDQLRKVCERWRLGFSPRFRVSKRPIDGWLPLQLPWHLTFLSINPCIINAADKRRLAPNTGTAFSMEDHQG